MRDYERVVRRAEAAAPTRTIGEADGYPIVAASAAPPGNANRERPRVLLIAGTHGDEPAGVEAALRLLERKTERPPAHFEILPCVNPHGYIRNRRLNSGGDDLNWSYLRLDLPEIAAVHQVADNQRFDAVIDLHEDWESPGFYIYELSRRGKAAEQVVQAVAEVCPINTNSEIEGDAAENGVLRPDSYDPIRKARGDGIPIALFHNHTDLYLTMETPTAEPMETRVQAHLRAVEAAVRFLSA